MLHILATKDDMYDIRYCKIKTILALYLYRAIKKYFIAQQEILITDDRPEDSER